MAFPVNHFRFIWCAGLFYKVNRFRKILAQETCQFLDAKIFKVKHCSLDRWQLGSLFIHSQTKVLPASEFLCPRPVTLATNVLFPSDTKPELKKPPCRLKAPRVERKTAITGRWGRKLNTGKLLHRVSGGHGKMILSFLSLLKYLSLAPGTIGSCVLV